MIERSPSEFRAAYDKWKITAPSNDSDIIPHKPRASAKPRHDDLSKELHGLLFWRHINQDVQPLSTNWMVPNNDNDIDKEEDEPRAPLRSTECEHIIRPSEVELMAAVAGVEFETRIDHYKVPIAGDDVEYGNEYKTVTGTVRPIARLGTVRFATTDAVGAGQTLSPTRGSIVGWHAGPGRHGYFPVDDFGAPLGSDEDQENIDSSNQFFADLLNAKPHRYITGGLRRRTPSGRSSRPLVSFLEPNDHRTALPCGSRRASDSFVGHKITSDKDASGNDQSADDWFMRIQERSDIRAKLSADDAKPLDTAINASNYSDIGNAFEFTGKTAERQGKRILLTASKNLSALIDLIAA